MGATQGKYHDTSPIKTQDLENMKMKNGNVQKQSLASHRRSTGQRYADRLYTNKPVSGNEQQSRQPPRSKNTNGSFGSSGSGGGVGDRNWRSDVDGGRKGSSGSGSSSGVKDTQSGSGGKGGGGYGRELQRQRRVRIQYGEEEMVDGWPKWLTDNVPKEVLACLTRKSAENYVKIDKVGQGTYSNVYKARDKVTGKIVALKKVRFDTSEPESVKFMAREIMILQKLDHPNVVKLEGLATSRLQYSLYLVFDFMQSDLARIISRPEGRLTEAQVKCYMHQLLSGLQHCHDRGILHRDIKGSNLLIDSNGVLKIADFGLANYYSPKSKHPLTSRVVTLWYRAPELLLGATNYGFGIDLWSAGCLLAEMLAGRPIMPGRTEVEQLHRIFQLCGTPSEEYWKKFKLTCDFRPPKSYQPTLFAAFGEFPESSLGLLTTMLALDPAQRGSASSALQNEFFYTSPLACELSGLPKILQDEDELIQAYEHRNRRRSKIKHRTRTLLERKKKDTAADRLKEEDTTEVKEEPEQNLMSNIQGQGPRSGTNNITFSEAKASDEVESSSYIFSPFASPKLKMSPRIVQDHQKGIKNLPPLPATKNYNNTTSNNYRLNQVLRSASTREFRKLNQRDALKFYAIDE